MKPHETLRLSLQKKIKSFKASVMVTSGGQLKPLQPPKSTTDALATFQSHISNKTSEKSVHTK